MQISICAILSIQLVLVLILSAGVFLYTIVVEEEAIADSVDYGEAAVSSCFDQYLDSIKTIGESFITDISLQLKDHVNGVVDYAEAKARAAATSVERTGFMDAMAANSWHGSLMLPSFGWMILSPLEEDEDGENAVVADIVIASLNSTEEFNTWVWFGLPSRNPNPSLSCDFYYYRNATNSSSSLWCLEDLYKQPDAPSPSIFPHPYSPAIYKLQNATPRELPSEVARRPLAWMPLNFYVSTNNVVALTSVVGGVYDPDGSCEGFAAANVRFTSISNFLSTLVDEARYADLNIALIETGSGMILGTSLGSAIYKENQTLSDGTTLEVEQAASLAQTDHPLAKALDHHIEESYGSIDKIPTPTITSVTLEGREYFVSFDTFSRPLLNLTICVFLPHVSITGPIEAQRHVSQINMEASAKEMADSRKQSFIIVIIIGVGGLMACGAIASSSAAFISVRIKALLNFVEKVRSKLSNLVDEDIARVNSKAILCEPLPADFFPDFGTTPLKDVNEIIAATNDLCSQLLKTWNTKQEAFQQALEQRQFTASIAHDIRNPLHGLLGIVSMMQSNIEDHQDKLPLLADTLQHMATLLNDMVDLSKIQGGKVAHVSKRLDAWDCLAEVVTLYRGTVESSGGTLSCMERTALPFAHSDPVHVQRIMANFVSNASKYAAGSDIVLKAVAATRQQVRSLTFLNYLGGHFSDDAPRWAENSILEADEFIVMACLDKGRGIPPTKLDKVFEAYQQTRDSDRSRGAGLGLAIVKGLAVEMGGGVGVQSQVGSGSLFWLVVPSVPTAGANEKALPPPKGEALESTKPERLSNPPAPQPGLYLNCHVLVVDDTNLNLMLLKHFLAKLGIKAEVSTSAMDGLNKLREDPKKFSLILSDFNMPEMSGGEMCLEVRKDQHLCHLPFICTSGNLLTESEKEKYKIDNTMMKPFTIDQLRETIRPYIQLSDE